MFSKIKKIIPVIVSLVLFDYLTKYFVKTKFFPFTKINVIEHFLNLVYVKNKGIAFGFLSTLPEYMRKIFLIWIPVLTCVVLFFYILSSKKISKLATVGFILIISGAIGNLIDRIFYGYVVDFLDFYFKGFHWPAFNFADSYISVGIFFIFLDTFVKGKS